MDKQKKIYFEEKIKRADQTQMISIIYEILIFYINDYLNNDSTLSLLYADKCIDELLKSINYDVACSKDILNIYTFCKQRLYIGKKEDIIEIRKIFEKFLQTYKNLEKNNSVSEYVTYNKRGLLNID